MKTFLAALLGALLLIPASPSRAQWHDHERNEERHEEHHEGWRGGFHEHDLALWRGGAWFHGDHDGRLGWWWRVGPSWYFYPAPVYPYPDPYVPPVAVAPPPAPGPYWYYCANPQGYYPYVPQCLVPWRPVPPG